MIIVHIPWSRTHEKGSAQYPAFASASVTNDTLQTVRLLVQKQAEFQHQWLRSTRVRNDENPQSDQT